MARVDSRASTRLRPAPLTVGWREWVALPSLGLPAIKAKLDTGARTSALHAFYVDPYEVGGLHRVRFGIHPLQGRKDIVVDCAADIVDLRQVTDSGGHREMRYVIAAPLTLGDITWPVEITLTNRDDMLFRFLIGRTAMSGRLAVDPRRSYVIGALSTEAYGRRRPTPVRKRGRV
ncbi:MAG: ATP-dependent zinc protease [Alphaproteobacteria bacterium]|nr:ATP-dependent zinc protease [Alphaproteobacteria bacterium]